MSAAQLQCPRCAGMLQVDSSWGGRQIACPLCQGPIQLPTEALLQQMAGSPPAAPPLPPPTPPPVLPQASNEPIPPPALPLAASLPPDRTRPQAKDRVLDLLPPGAAAALPAMTDVAKGIGAGDESVELRRLTPEARARRRFRRSLLLWALCLAILLSVCYFLTRPR